MKRESEIQRTMSESADARNIAQQVVEVMRPHLARVQQNGMSPFQAIGNIFQIEESLAVGSMAVKAATIAQLVKSYNIDIQALDSALAGAPLPADTQVQSQVQELLRREMAPFQQMMQQAQQRRANMQRQYEEQAASELDTFAADPKNEFLDDVKDAMADIIELGVRRGVDISTADAYAQACQFDPRVKAVIASRNTRTTSISAAAAARKARAAAVSISGAPVIGDDVTKTPDHLRGAIEAAMEVHSTR
jgi:hypothetical protein